MKRLSNFYALLLVGCAALSVGCCGGGGGEVVVSDGLRFNESTLPYGDGLLVANFGASALNPLNDEGRGYISIYKDGRVSSFIPADGSLSAPKGMLVKGGYLLVCDVQRVVVYNLADLNAKPQIVRFPEGEVFVNDILAIGDTIYISVTNTGNIFRLDGSDLGSISAQLPERWFNIVGANGLVAMDDSLFVASYPADGVTTTANVIYVIDDVRNPVAFMLIQREGQWDGLALSEDRSTLYASSWSPAEVVAVSLETGEVEVLDFETEFVGAADFSIVGDRLYIPDLPNSQLIIKQL